MSRLRSPMALTFGTRVALLAAGFLNAAIAARWYGPTAAAQIGLMGSLLGLTAVVSLGGSELYVLKRLAGRVEPEDSVFAAAIVRTLVFAIAVIGLLALINVSGVGQAISSTLTTPILVALIVVIPVNAVRVLLYECLRSREMVLEYNALTALYPSVALIALVIYPLLLDGLSFAWVVVIGECVGFLGASWLIVRRQSVLRLHRVSLRDLADYTRGSRPFFVSTLSVVALQADILVVGLLLPAEQVGIYVVATRLAQVVRLPMTASGIGFAPRVASIYRDMGRRSAADLARKQSLIVFPMTLALALPLLLLGPLVLDLLGSAFAQSYSIMVLLIGAELMMAFAGQAGLLLAMTNFERQQQWIFLVSAAVLIVLSVGLVSTSGPIGGGVALLAASTVRSSLGLRVVKTNFGEGVSAWHALYGRLSTRRGLV